MKNARIAYLLSFLWRSWFWLGIWVFYCLRFTDYAGIGFLEAVMITTSTLGEIPTGAIADILGKKRAVGIAFFLGAVGNVAMALAPNYTVLMISIITMTIGGCFYSGSLEALVYDSLKQEKIDDMFEKVVARMESMTNLGMAVAGITGGFLYQIHHSLPFLMVGVAYLIGLFAALYLTEPVIDTERYSWKAFINQNKMGFHQLFGNVDVRKWIFLLLIPGSFMVATENVLNDATAIEIGFNSVALGIFATILYLVGILVSEKSATLIKRINNSVLFVGLVGIYIITLLVIPKASFILGAVLLLVRYGMQTVFGNLESVRINRIIDSRYRATSLSTYSLVKNIPYVLAATGIGFMISLVTAKQFSMYFGVLLGALLAIYAGITRPWVKHTN